MKTNRRIFIKRLNWALAGLITTLGYNSCGKEPDSPDKIYTVKGAVTNKATGKPIEGICVGYDSVYQRPVPMYGPPPANYNPKAHILTDAKGIYKLTDKFRPEEILLIDNVPTLSVFVSDVDGEKNGLFHSEFLQVDFSDAVRSRNSNGSDEYTVTMDVELTEIEN